VSETGPGERGRLSGPHQIAVRAKYKIPLRTSSAPSNIRNILASQLTTAQSAQALTAFCAVNSHRWGRPQARRFDPAGFSFGFGGCGKLLILPFKFLLFRRRRWNRSRKSGGPPLFELSLKVQRDIAHNAPQGSRSCPGATALNARGALKVLNGAPRNQRRPPVRWAVIGPHSTTKSDPHQRPS